MTSILKTFAALIIVCTQALAESPAPILSHNETKALALVGKASKEADTIERELDRLRSLKFIARTQAKMGDIPAAMKTIERIEKEATSEKSRKFCLPGAYSGIAYAQAKSGDLKAAFATAEKGNTDVLEIVAAQAETSGIADAMQTVDAMLNAKLKDFALQNISLARAKVGDFTGAMQVADTIQSASTKGDTYGTIAVIQARKGDSVSSQRSLARITNPLARAPFEKNIKDGPLTDTKIASLPTAFERCEGYLSVAWALLDTDDAK